MKRYVLLLVLSAIAITYLPGCATPRPTGPVVYMANNLHVIDNYSRSTGKMIARSSCTGWIGPATGHRIVPVNTPVVLGAYTQHGRQTGFMLYLTNGEDVFYEFHEKHMLMDFQRYQHLITNTDKLSLKNLTEIDKEGIRKGKPMIGMSRRAVQIACGIPPAHATRSLDADRWIYWRKRTGKRVAVDFDQNGRVVSVR